MAINQQITSAPPAPQRSDPNTFADKADAFVAWLENLDDELNQWASECNSTEENINDSEQTVLQAKSDTLAARDQAVAEANAKVYDDSETYNYPDCVIGSDGHIYRCMGNNITEEDPVTSTSGNWKRLSVALNSNKQLELPFAQTPILVNGQDMMSRTFYVDAENGDDNNDGSESAPFKTIKKACDNVLNGGYGTIYLSAGQIFHISEVVGLDNQTILIYGNSSNNPKVIFDTYDNGSYNYSRNIYPSNGRLYIRQCILENAEKSDSNLSWAVNDWSDPIVLKYNGILYLYDCTINQTNKYFISTRTGFGVVYLSECSVNFSGDAIALVDSGSGCCAFNIYNSTATTGYKWVDGTIGQNVITGLSSLDT